ncbi:MAG: hypothetical protein QNK24_15320 [Desulfuromusa sp.]|nr:hypothetical protein [Desulfuromusa sp.]
MKRFRITIIAICIVLGWLGFSDLSILLRNSEPLDISISELETTGAPREWLRINKGYQDLQQAINMSGTMEIDSFLIPLKTTPSSGQIKIWFETREPNIIAALKTYYFVLETEAQQKKYLQENQQFFSDQHQVTGMIVGNTIADSNQQKLIKLLEGMNIPVTKDLIFISEGKKPAVWRGIFFTVIAIAGLVKTLLTFRKTG